MPSNELGGAVGAERAGDRERGRRLAAERPAGVVRGERRDVVDDAAHRDPAVVDLVVRRDLGERLRCTAGGAAAAVVGGGQLRRAQAIQRRTWAHGGAVRQQDLVFIVLSETFSSIVDVITHIHVFPKLTEKKKSER